MDWLLLAPPTMALVLVLLVPGWTVLTLLGRSGLRSLTAAPAVSVGVVALAALACDRLGLAWGPGPVVVVAVAVGALAFAVRRWTPHPLTTPASDPSGRWRTPTALAGLGAFLGGLLLWARHLTNVLPSPRSFSQTFDNVFHLNVIRFIHEVGDPGPWLPYNLDVEATRTIFYPTAWHQLGALALPLGDGSVQVASNAVLFVVCAVVWPLSALELVLALRVRTPAALLSTGVLAAGFSAYPFLMLNWGVLYPNLLSYACVPAALALLVALVRPGLDPARPLLPLALAAGLAALGVLIGHPNGFLLLLLLALPAVLDGALRTGRLARTGRIRWRWAALWWAGATVALLAFARAWQVARPSNRPWPPLHDLETAVGQAILANPIMGPPAAVPAVLTVIGLALVALRGGHWWFVGAAVLGLTLWVVGSGAPEGPVRELLTGIWYSDSYRLGPILTLLAVPAAAFAVDHFVLSLQPPPAPARALDAPAPAPRRATLGLTVLIPALILATTQWSPALHEAVTHARRAHDLAEVTCAEGDLNCLVTPDELAVLADVRDLTPPDAVMLAEPLTGASLAYAFTGRTVLRPYIGPRPDPAEQYLLDHLDSPAPGPGLCEALAATGVTHVLDFGTQTVHSGVVAYAGVDELGTAPEVREVVRHGEAALYEVTACR